MHLHYCSQNATIQSTLEHICHIPNCKATQWSTIRLLLTRKVATNSLSFSLRSINYRVFFRNCTVAIKRLRSKYSQFFIHILIQYRIFKEINKIRKMINKYNKYINKLKLVAQKRSVFSNFLSSRQTFKLKYCF